MSHGMPAFLRHILRDNSPNILQRTNLFSEFVRPFKRSAAAQKENAYSELYNVIPSRADTNIFDYTEMLVRGIWGTVSSAEYLLEAHTNYLGNWQEAQKRISEGLVQKQFYDPNLAWREQMEYELDLDILSNYIFAATNTRDGEQFQKTLNNLNDYLNKCAIVIEVWQDIYTAAKANFLQKEAALAAEVADKEKIHLDPRREAVRQERILTEKYEMHSVNGHMNEFKAGLESKMFECKRLLEAIPKMKEDGHKVQARIDSDHPKEITNQADSGKTHLR